VLTEDLKNTAQGNAELAADVNLLAEQVLRCKLIVQNLARAAEQPSNTPQRAALNACLVETLTHWQLLQPRVSLKTELLANDVSVLVDTTLKQALINLLNNAAEASPSGIELRVAEQESARQVSIYIRDHGPGVQLDANKVGKPFASTRGPGRGLGLFVSNAAIERLGGSVTLNKHPGGGTLTTVTLPCV
jgi:two-component system sensor histidine kinase RegB